jgi:hypothetical protein
MTSPEDSEHDDARDKGGHIPERAQKRIDIVRDLLRSDLTSIEMANAKAASMKVSNRVICMPRKRNPLNRGSASSSVGIADAISSSRSVITAVLAGYRL